MQESCKKYKNLARKGPFSEQDQCAILQDSCKVLARCMSKIPERNFHYLASHFLQHLARII